MTKNKKTCKHKWHLIGHHLEVLVLAPYIQTSKDETKVDFICEKCGEIKVVEIKRLK